MPAVLIEVKRKYTDEEVESIIDAVHKSMMESINIPEWDLNIRFVEHDPKRFASPPDKTDKHTIITFDMFSGRSREAKKELYKSIVSRLSSLGIPKQDVMIILHEVPPECWGIRGGQAACDVDLGFKINV